MMAKMKHLFFVEQNYCLPILRPLAAAAHARGDKVKWFFRILDRPDFLSAEDIVDTSRQVTNYNPDSVIAPGNWVPPNWPGVKTQVFHGFGIEKKGHFRIRGHFDLYCTHGPLTTDRFQELALEHRHFTVVETGWPKLDPWSSRIQPSVPNEPYRILYAPTFSPNLSSALALLDEWRSIALDERFRVTCKFHPLEEETIIAKYAELGGQISISNDPDVLSEISNADVVVTDTSSVVAEALYFDTPVITFRTKEPGPHVVNFTEPSKLQHLILADVTGYDHAKERGRNLADQMHPYRDGKSSDRVLDAIGKLVTQGLSADRRKPLNLIRRMKIARKMRHYR